MALENRIGATVWKTLTKKERTILSRSIPKTRRLLANLDTALINCRAADVVVWPLAVDTGGAILDVFCCAIVINNETLCVRHEIIYFNRTGLYNA